MAWRLWMFFGGSRLMLVLLLGPARVLAQESRGIMPTVEHPAVKSKAAHVTPKRVAKPAAPAEAQKIAAPTTVAQKTAALNSETPIVEPAPASEIPPGERLKIQSALLWSGDYTASIGGEDPLLSAIKNFQKRVRSKVTGVLSSAERTNLVAAAKNHEDEFGWSVVADPATGVRIGLPTKLVSQTRDAARGTRWSSAHGEVQVETFRIKDTDVKLAAFFDQQKKEPSTRKVESSALRDDNFYISGMQGLKIFSVRAYARDGEIRGYMLLFDQMMETIVAPVTSAMVSAFSPFPERTSAFAAMAKSVEYGTGLVVSARGHIVTDRKLATDCQVIVAAGLGDAERIAEDKENGLALVRVYGPHKLSPLPFVPEAAKKGDVTLVGIPDPKEQNGAKKLTEIKARLADNAIELRQPVPMAGFSGAAAIDSQGQFLGMMEMRSFVLASTESTAPPVRLITADAIRDFLAARDVPYVSSPSQGADASASVVRIICVRQ